MPADFAGDKWACEACVRGHRATRCDHFDRWMVRVKKPGRPLRECPHAGGPCACADDKVIMMRVPKIETKGGGCLCQKIRSFDPALDGNNAQHSRGSSRMQDPWDMNPYLNFQPNPQSPVQHSAQHLAFQHHTASLNASASTANGQDVRAEPPQFLPLQDPMQPQQLPSNADSSDWGMPAATPMTVTQGSQVIHQQPSHSDAPVHSPMTLQSSGLPQQVGPDDHLDPSLRPPPEHLDAANLQPLSSPFNPFQHVMSGNHGQELHNVSTTVQSPISNTQYRGDPATLAQSMRFEQLGYQYPEHDDPYGTTSAAGPSAELNDVTSSPNCQCGPGCDCVFCASHPYNAATRERVQDLTQIMATDNCWSGNSASRPHSGYGGAPTNGTGMESMTEQGYPPLGNEPFPFPASGWTNSTVQGPALQPTFNQDAFVDNGDHSNELFPRTTRSTGYYLMEYNVNSNCTDATGTCLCGSDCKCSGCLTHQGHNGPPD